METVISGVIVLCMFYQQGLIEHTYIQDQKMSSCLKAKRQVERSVNPENIRMQCGEVDAIIEEDKTSNPPRYRIVKIVKALRDKINVPSQVLGEELKSWI